jgi:proteasome accessory factor C
LSGEDRFNFMLSLAGYLIRGGGQATLAEIAEHFAIAEDQVESALRTLNLASAKFEDRPEDLFYEVDIDLLDEKIVQFRALAGSPEAPRLTTRQASAIAAGLQYLASIPEFAASEEIAELQEILAAGSGLNGPPAIEVRPGSIDSDAEVIRRAIATEHRISCEYVNQRGELSQRQIDPLRLIPDGQHWYLSGYCHTHQEVRSFRLDRMRAAQILEDEICADAKKVVELDDSTYIAQATDIEVVVEVQPEAYRLITESQTIQEPKDVGSGTIRTTIKVGHLANLGRLISRYGGAARVIEPPEARAAVKAFALKSLGQNDELKHYSSED